MIPDEKIEEFVRKFPLLMTVAKKLNGVSIDWMIGGSGCLYLLGNKRAPEDVDIFLPDIQHDTADKLFGIESYTYVSPAGPVRNSNPAGDHSIQLTSHLEFNFDKHYEFSVTPLTLQHKIKFIHENVDLYLLSPEEVLLIKALLQRGMEEGKSDIEDIGNFMEIYQVDHEYLLKRVKELGAEQRIGNIFKH